MYMKMCVFIISFILFRLQTALLTEECADLSVRRRKLWCGRIYEVVETSKGIHHQKDVERKQVCLLLKSCVSWSNIYLAFCYIFCFSCSACMLTFADYSDAENAITELRDALPEEIEVRHTKTDNVNPGTCFAFNACFPETHKQFT